jgi:hypothetical protein
VLEGLSTLAGRCPSLLASGDKDKQNMDWTKTLCLIYMLLSFCQQTTLREKMRLASRPIVERRRKIMSTLTTLLTSTLSTLSALSTLSTLSIYFLAILAILA